MPIKKKPTKKIAKKVAKKAAAKKPAARAADRKTRIWKRPPAAKPAAASMSVLIPHLVVDSGARAMDFYRAAFGAEELERVNTPDGRLMHGEIRILGQRVFVSDEFEPSQGGSLRSPRSLGGTPVRITLEVNDADAAADRAVAAGAEVMMPVQDMFWGARYGKLRDPFGHEWAFNQQQRDLSPAENQAATDAFFRDRDE